jgi:hypothetical protein
LCEQAALQHTPHHETSEVRIDPNSRTNRREAEATDVVADSLLAVNREENRGRDQTRTNELKAVNQATAEAPHLKAEAKAEEIWPNEAEDEDEDEEHEAAISHLGKINSKRNSSMVGAFSRRIVR